MLPNLEANPLTGLRDIAIIRWKFVLHHGRCRHGGNIVLPVTYFYLVECYIHEQNRKFDVLCVCLQTVGKKHEPVYLEFKIGDCSFGSHIRTLRLCKHHLQITFAMMDIHRWWLNVYGWQGVSNWGLAHLSRTLLHMVLHTTL